MPKIKFKFKFDNQTNFTTNWNTPVDFLKNPHKSKELKKDNKDTLKVISFRSFSSFAGTTNNNKIPKIGNNKINSNKFLV
jgi:hypothetical protein